MEIHNAKTQSDLEALNREYKDDCKRILAELAKKLGVEIFFDDKTPLLDSSGIYCDGVTEVSKYCCACGSSGEYFDETTGFMKCPFCGGSGVRK